MGAEDNQRVRSPDHIYRWSETMSWVWLEAVCSCTLRCWFSVVLAALAIVSHHRNSCDSLVGKLISIFAQTNVKINHLYLFHKSFSIYTSMLTTYFWGTVLGTHTPWVQGTWRSQQVALSRQRGWGLMYVLFLCISYVFHINHIRTFKRYHEDKNILEIGSNDWSLSPFVCH